MRVGVEGEIWNLEEVTVLVWTFQAGGLPSLVKTYSPLLSWPYEFLRRYLQSEYSACARDCLGIAVRKGKLGSADDPLALLKPPWVAPGPGVVISQARALSLTPQPGRATWWPLCGERGQKQKL